MKHKYIYKNTDWSNYQKALVNRGKITLWFNEDAIKSWFAKPVKYKRGAPFIYSNEAILCALTIRAVYKMPLRSVEGLLISLDLLQKSL